MGAFSSIDIANTGVGFARYWLDTLAHNLANTNTVLPGDEEPFRARMVVAQQLGAAPFARTGSGIAVRGVLERGGEATRSLDPDNPLADEEGYVVLPVMDLAGEMTDLVVAARSYQVSARVMQSGREAYLAALRLGRS